MVKKRGGGEGRGWNWTGGQFAWLSLLGKRDYLSDRGKLKYNAPEQRNGWKGERDSEQKI